MSRIVSLILPYYNRLSYLKATLDGFQYFYAARKDFQIVIVDDQSKDADRPDDLIKEYTLWIDLVRIQNKKGINPCYPINVGVRQSVGDVILLSSPEVIHTRNIFDHCKDFEQLTDFNYIQFSVFCVTSDKLRLFLLDNSTAFEHKASLINAMNTEFHMGLGVKGYPHLNMLGAWYTHSKLASSCYNFLSACTRNTYYTLSGFNESFVKGTGYDDAEFRDRLLRHVNNNVIWYDDFIAIHVDHPAASSNNNTNLALYNQLKSQTYERNDNWGRL